MDPGLTLIGLPTAGKTTVAQLLAPQLGFGFLDVDAWMAEREGARLPDVVRRRGEQYMLDLEETCLAAHDLWRTVVSPPGCVIHTGARELLRSRTVVVHLDTPVAVVEARMAADTSGTRRVVGLGPDGFAGLAARRTPLYRDWAHATIDTRGQDPPQTADAVLAVYVDHVARGRADGDAGHPCPTSPPPAAACDP